MKPYEWRRCVGKLREVPSTGKTSVRIHNRESMRGWEVRGAGHGGCRQARQGREVLRHVRNARKSKQGARVWGYGVQDNEGCHKVKA